MRDPSLHIRKSDLERVLNELQYDSRTAGKKLAEMIFAEAQPYQITDRYLQLLQQNTKVKAKASKSMEADERMPDGTVEKFNLLLTTFRQSSNINARVRVIRKDSKEYILLKEVAANAYEFASHFTFVPKEEGLKKYIETGIGFMGKYGLNRFKTYNERIFEEFENELTVLTDAKRKETDLMHEVWNGVMQKWLDNTWYEDLRKDNKKYIHIYYAREEADKLEANYVDWVEAQFEGLAFMNVIPELSQFYGENARRRYERYINKVIVEAPEERVSLSNIYKNQIDNG